MGYPNIRQTVGTLLSSVPRREEERYLLDTYRAGTLHVLQENPKGLLDLLDGGTQSPTGGDFFPICIPTYLVPS